MIEAKHLMKKVTHGMLLEETVVLKYFLSYNKYLL